MHSLQSLIGWTRALVEIWSAVQVRWHRSLDNVRGDTPALYIAHEFFDALPVHHFQRTSRGWRERLVDVSQDPADPHHLRLVLAPNETPASRLLLPPRLAGLTPADSKLPCAIKYPTPVDDPT